MKKLTLTVDAIEVITNVTGQKIRCMFNDKRKDCVRRYKFSGVYGVTKPQIRTINHILSDKYPDFQFVVQNSIIDKTKSNSYSKSNFYGGLTIKVF